MRVLGWLGTILCAPCYCFFMLMDKLKVLYWIPIGTGVYGAYLVFVGVQSIIQDSMGSGRCPIHLTCSYSRFLFCLLGISWSACLASFVYSK